MLIQSCKKENSYRKEPNLEIDKQLSLFRQSIGEAGAKVKAKTLVRSVAPNNSVSTPNEEDAITFVEEVESPALALIKSYGISEQEIINELGSLDPGKIALAAETILEAENMIDNGQALPIFEDEDYHLVAATLFGIGNANAQTNNLILKAPDNTIGGCIAEAIGITAAFEALEKGVMGLGKKGALKLIRKVAGRALGPIGAVLAAYDFVDCMGWI